MNGRDDQAGEIHAGERRVAAIAVALGGVAGYVDIVGWILLSHIYVANMSGNTIALGRSLARHDLRDAAVRLWPVLLFVLGLFASELIYEVARRNGRRSSAGWTLTLEAAAIAFVTILPWPAAGSTSGAAYYVQSGLLALAMGLQNATLVRVGASSVYTTHVTGNLTRLAREAAHMLLFASDRARGRVRGRVLRRRSTRRVLLMTTMWIAYGIGAVLGTWAADRWGRHGATAAVVVLTALVAYDAFQPIGGHEQPADPHPLF